MEPQPANPLKRCRILADAERVRDEVEADWKRQGFWVSRKWADALWRDYARVTQLIRDAGGEFDPTWPMRLAVAAEVVLDCRNRVEIEALEQLTKAKPAWPTSSQSA